jgi:hypothetical protein
MIGKKVRVFWPIDSSWYTGTVQQYDSSTGEHLLGYEDDDTEWVKIGESNTTASPSSGPPSHGPPPHRRGRNGTGSPHEGSMLEPIPPVSPAGHMIDHGDSHHPGSYPHPPPVSDHQVTVSPATPDHKWQHGEHGSQRMGGPSHHSYPPYGSPSGPHQQSMYPPHINYHSSQGGLYPGYHPGHQMSHGPPPPGGYPYHMMGMPPHMGPPGHEKNPPQSSPSPTNSLNGKRKNGPKAWTKEEDALLLNIVQGMRMPMKWSFVAQSLPERTGKQCRERYVNHLNPRLKITDWSPLEDATIFHLYNTIGSHWAKMSKMIPGRTDNGIKNRFHNLRRQLEREDEHRLRLSTARDFPEEIRLDRIRDFPEDMKGKAAELWDMKSGISVLAAQSVLGGSMPRNQGRFGPFRPAEDDDVCVRCGFFIPSVQTGNEICTKTGWCQSCARIPPHVSGNMLRECLNLRRSQNAKQREVVESWEDPFSSGEALKETAVTA